MLYARRDFLASSRRLGGFGLFLASLGVGGTVAVKHFIKMADPLSRAYHKSRKGFPLSFDYLGKLVNDSGITLEEMEGILSKNPGQEGLYTLIAYSLLQRAKKNGELSLRYSEYLDTMSELVKAGKVKFRLTDKLREQDIDFLYELSENVVYVDSSKILEIDNITLMESSIIHELFHGFQNSKGGDIKYSRFEVEASLAQSDFIWHVEPELLSKEQWVHLFPIEGGFKIKFFVPERVVSFLSSFESGNKKLEETIAETRKKYLLTRAIQGSTNPKLYQMLASQIPSGATKGDVYRTLVEQIERILMSIKTKPLKDHLECTFKPIKGTGKLGNCKPSIDLMQFSTLTHFLMICAWKNGERGNARMLGNYYFINVLLKESDSLLNHPELDGGFLLVGIR